MHAGCRAVIIAEALTGEAPLCAQNVRVVQRNLVYVVGLALELCFEDLLKGPEYFGQFGKIVKVHPAAC